MSSAIQTRIYTLAKDASGFTPKTVSLGDFKVIDRGTPPYAIITPGPVKIAATTFRGSKSFEWTYYIDVVARFLDDSYEPLLTARQAMLDRLLPYHKLNNLAGVLSFLVSEIGEVNLIYTKGSKEMPQFMMQQLTTLTVTTYMYDGQGDYA